MELAFVPLDESNDAFEVRQVEGDRYVCTLDRVGIRWIVGYGLGQGFERRFRTRDLAEAFIRANADELADCDDVDPF